MPRALFSDCKCIVNLDEGELACPALDSGAVALAWFGFPHR